VSEVRGRFCETELTDDEVVGLFCHLRETPVIG
jgi:hypothetical protein